MLDPLLRVTRAGDSTERGRAGEGAAAARVRELATTRERREVRMMGKWCEEKRERIEKELLELLMCCPPTADGLSGETVATLAGGKHPQSSPPGLYRRRVWGMQAVPTLARSKGKSRFYR